MASYQHDLVVVGAGPAGYAAALYGSAAGLNVALVERDKVGGTCLHRGCIPAKEWLETAAVARTVGHAEEFGVRASLDGLDVPAALARKDKIVSGLHTGLTGMLKRRKVNVVAGTGRLVDAHTVEVELNDGTGGGDVADGGTRGDTASGTVSLTASNVLLTAGSVPRTLPGLEVDGKLVVTSDELLDIDHIPARVAVVGGGAIGCEFASMLADLGSRVTILELADGLVPGVDADVARALARSFKRRKIGVRTGVSVGGHEPQADGSTNVLVRPADQPEAKPEALAVDLVVVSVGRRPYPDFLNAQAAGVAVDDRGFVEVTPTCRTSVEGVYAAGDLINTPQLAHVGFAEAMVVVRDILGENPMPVDYVNVPWAIYCHPEVAFAGLTEEAAKQAGYDVVTVKHTIAGNARAQIVGTASGLVKIVAERNADGGAGRLLGVHMVGPWVTELLAPGYLAVNWEATVDDVAAFIAPHPTLGEMFGEAVLSLTGRGLHA